MDITEIQSTGDARAFCKQSDAFEYEEVEGTHDRFVNMDRVPKAFKDAVRSIDGVFALHYLVHIDG